MAIFCIGDIHGKFDRLALLIEELPESAKIICLGDIGLGFDDTKSPQCLDEIDKIAKNRNQNIWLLRGNHDAPEIWHSDRHTWNSHLTNIRIPSDIHRMMIENIHVIMVGGAISIDRSCDRIDGRNWWSGEAVADIALPSVTRLVDAYGKADLLITHVGPFEAQPGMERDEETLAYYSHTDPNLRTDIEKERRLISQIVVASQARQSVFGHYHITKETEIDRIKYRCCAELEVWQYIKKTSLPPLPSSR